MRHTRFASIVFLLTLLLVNSAKAPAQTAYMWAKYSLPGYGTLDVGYVCEDGRLKVAVHGEASGSLGIALGNDDPRSTSFDGSNAMGPDGYYTQGLVEKAAECDQRASWPIISITTSNGQSLKIRWQ